MSLALYLAIVDGNNNPVVGSVAPANVHNPFRNNAVVNRPLAVSSVEFGGDLPVTNGTGGTPGAGKVVLGDVVVTLPDDSATPNLFRLLCTGARYNSADVIAVTTGDSPKVVSGVGLANVFVSSLDRTLTTDGVIIKASFTATLFSVGSAPQRPDGGYAPFTYLTYDISRNQVG